VGERPLPGRRKARRLRPGISKHLGNRWEDGSTPMWDSLRHLSGFFEGQSPPRGSERLDTRGGQDLQKNAQKQRGGGPMDDRRRMKISGAKKGRGEVGGAGRRSTRNVPHHLFSAQSEYLLVGVPAAPSALRALIWSVHGLP